eukprot:CAMPEP_0185725402 /NCGR_PEP_ID=MMETSP1171-20130828/1672_1 /TAXON_ID=374046 /ORGANISM="Helicotheca tamensis, Strain CCMP826" /LENGTH=387 /DNA_ID=CAMNT_0028393525 /DNA_START=129 /DNA_END=1292 /DNA_ORIENTATION=+
MTNTAVKAAATASTQGNATISSKHAVPCKTSLTSSASIQFRPFATALLHDTTSENWSPSLSSASPETDFTSASLVRQFSDNHRYDNDDDDEEYKALQERYMQYLESNENAHHCESLAYSLSLASPPSESEFTTSPLTAITPFLSETMKEQLEHSTNQLLLITEKDNVTEAKNNDKDDEYAKLQDRYLHFLEADENADQRDSFTYSQSLASSPETSDFTSSHVSTMLSETMKTQLQKSTNQLLPKFKKEERAVPLPRSYKEAIQNNSNDAIVITSKRHPFRIISVNDAWTNLCGYTQDESYGKTLKSLLHGPDTYKNGNDVDNVMFHLVEKHQTSEMTLVNYTKSGRPFVNHVRVGPLVDEESGEITHFVGLLSEVMMENKKGMTTAV